MAAKKPMPKGKGNPFMDKAAAKRGTPMAGKSKKSMPMKGGKKK